MSLTCGRFAGYHNGPVIGAVYNPSVESIISIGDDKMIMCSLWRRDSSSFWPSVAHSLPTYPTALAVNAESRRVFVGLDNGSIIDFVFSEDYNSIETNRIIAAHTGRVSDICYDHARELLFSSSRDKSVAVHNTLGGAGIARHRVDAWLSVMQYDDAGQNLFASDFKGNIHVLHFADNQLKPVNVLTGHSSCIRSLLWVPSKRMLFSGGEDHNTVQWDIGGQKGAMFELCRHTEAVNSLFFLSESNELVSCSPAETVVWSMSAERLESPEWMESDTCKRCTSPFMWNFSEMWSRKAFALNRQHHCRICGEAVCDDCSTGRSTYPKMGFELPVRVCKACMQTLSQEDKPSLCRVVPTKKVLFAKPVDGSELIITILSDYSVNIIKLADFLGGSTVASNDTARRAVASVSGAGAGAGAGGAKPTQAPNVMAYSIAPPQAAKASLLDSLSE